MADPITTHILGPDTQGVLLLCGRLGRFNDTGLKPLTEREYNALAEWLRGHDMRPSDLLADEGLGRLEAAGPALPVAFPRLSSLLERGGALALAVESWSNKGLWVISRSDEAYPHRFRAGRLGPPLLYGAGNKDLLSLVGLAVVGSRDVDEEGLEFTRRVARACSGQQIQVVSGGARGVDIEAMLAAIEGGGSAVGVLADSLTKASVAGKYRAALTAGSLALVSPYDPAAGFDVGTAMGRNKYIYGLADWALVVSASLDRGGTWAGTVEALKSRRQVFVRTQSSTPEGNLKLLEKGALPFPDEPWSDLAEKLTHAEAPYPAGGVVQKPLLIEEERGAYSPTDSAARPAASKGGVPAAPQARQTLPESVYAAVLPLILSHLYEARDVASLAQLLDVRPAQLLEWLDRAVQEGKITKEGRPSRYTAIPS